MPSPKHMMQLITSQVFVKQGGYFTAGNRTPTSSLRFGYLSTIIQQLRVVSHHMGIISLKSPLFALQVAVLLILQMNLLPICANKEKERRRRRILLNIEHPKVTNSNLNTIAPTPALGCNFRHWPPHGSPLDHTLFYIIFLILHSHSSTVLLCARSLA